MLAVLECWGSNSRANVVVSVVFVKNKIKKTDHQNSPNLNLTNLEKYNSFSNKDILRECQTEFLGKSNDAN